MSIEIARLDLPVPPRCVFCGAVPNGVACPQQGVRHTRMSCIDIAAKESVSFAAFLHELGQMVQNKKVQCVLE